jgi:LmbE family N-acetylglucosaminyl deacetylase
MSSLPCPLPAVERGDRLLVLVPHPDDETLGAAGLLLQAHQVAASARVVIVTDGNRHGWGLRRRAESQRALAILEGPRPDVEFWLYPEHRLQDTAALRAQVSPLLAAYQPTDVVTTLPEDLNPDHRALGEAVAASAAASGYHGRLYGFLVHYNRYPRPRRYSPTRALLLPDRLTHAAGHWYSLPLTDGDERLKLAAVRQYRTQLSRRNPVLRELLYGLVRRNELYCDLSSGGTSS